MTLGFGTYDNVFGTASTPVTARLVADSFEKFRNNSKNFGTASKPVTARLTVYIVPMFRNLYYLIL